MFCPARWLPALLLLAGCGTWIFDDDSEAASSVNWYGSIIDGPYTGENGVLSGGDVLVDDLDGERLAEGTEPYSDTPGYWKLQVPPGEPVAIHLAGEEQLPAVWRGTTPTSTGYWYTGALFSYHEETWLPFFEDLEGQQGVSIEPLGEDSCWLWGAPYDPDAWAGAEIELLDGEGEPAVVLAYTLTEDDLLVLTSDEPVYYFFAFNMAPGDVTLSVQAADGRSLEETWPAWGGEVVSAWYVALAQEDS